MHKGFDLTHFGMGFIHLNLKFAVTVDAPEYDAIPTAHLAFHTSQMNAPEYDAIPTAHLAFHTSQMSMAGAVAS
uniref:Transposase n=1 Tax=Bursaphelenchus xylophilus TaxID=6326 RepID=A0A1I7RMD2_BURXY